ncbi:hypothetical protein Tco_0743184 [Tanacetum coccineum]
MFEIPAELKALEGINHSFQLHFSLGCKKGRAKLILDDVFDQKYMVILPGTSEPSLAAATVTIPKTSTSPKIVELNSVPAVSTTKIPEMLTPPKTIEVKSVPRIMKKTDTAIGSAKRCLSEHLAKETCSVNVKIPKQESSPAKQTKSL